ncbi:MAG TPA: response regulator [Polyangia bacterium]|nr:response regulator [Polyangia bacterium]
MADGEGQCDVPQVSAVLSGSQNHRILVVEDDEDSGDMLRFLLELCGHDVRLARCGAEGLAMAASWRPDIVISDLGLPNELDGYALARALRSNPLHRAAFLVALSGMGRDCDKSLALAAGFDFYLPKPVDLDALEAAVARAAQDPDGEGRGYQLSDWRAPRA